MIDTSDTPHSFCLLWLRKQKRDYFRATNLNALQQTATNPLLIKKESPRVFKSMFKTVRREWLKKLERIYDAVKEGRIRLTAFVSARDLIHRRLFKTRQETSEPNHSVQKECDGSGTPAQIAGSSKNPTDIKSGAMHNLARTTLTSEGSPQSDYGLSAGTPGKLGPNGTGGDLPSTNNPGEKRRYAFSLLDRLKRSCPLKERFQDSVDVLVESRQLKESALRAFKRDVYLLDLYDLVEQRACDCLYGIFTYSLGIKPDPSPFGFDKKRIDSLMEAKFGSLSDESREFSGIDDTEEAALQFSCYLARKVWAPVPWRSFDANLDSFYKRTVHSPINADVDQEALAIAKRILKLLCHNDRDKEFRDSEPVPDSSCLEATKGNGGKREVLYVTQEELYGFTQVCPQAIYTGGKIRVITIASAATTRYLWINKYLGSEFKKLKCSIFGGDVAEWWDRVQSKFKARDGERYVSGDLESATDLFDGRITSELIDDFCEMKGLSEEDASNIKSFTTEAKFMPSRDSFEISIEQTRGQLMGSEVSFPFLCILSLTAYIYGSEKLKAGIFQRKLGKSVRYLREISRVGINGDDIVFPAFSAAPWLEGVAAIGGVVSRGKSLVNPYFFTVNSELWSSDGRVFTARPSFLTAVNDGRKYFINPQREWLEYERQNLILYKEIYDMIPRLKADIPVRWGGLGLVKEFNPFRASLHKLLSEKRSSLARKTPWLGSAAGLKEKDEIRELLKQHGPKIKVRLTKAARDAYQKTYATRKAVWSDPPPIDKVFFKEILETARIMAYGSASRDLIFKEWNTLMNIPKNEVYFELPEKLCGVFYAKDLETGRQVNARIREYPKTLEFVPMT